MLRTLTGNFGDSLELPTLQKNEYDYVEKFTSLANGLVDVLSRKSKMS